LSPASGRALATPTQDMVLGGYFLTYSPVDLSKADVEKLKPRPKRFRSEEEVEFALEAKQKNVGLQDPIQYAWNGELIVTTPGRVIFNAEIERALGESIAIDGEGHEFINRTLDKKAMGDFIAELVDVYGAPAIAPVLDTIKHLGFTYATRAGISVSKNDVVIPPDKETILQ